MITMKSGARFAAAAALLALSGAASLSPAMAKDTDTVHCYGVNSCKGTSDCKTAHNDCKGMNSCKGHGFKAISSDTCKAQGGSTTEPK